MLLLIYVLQSLYNFIFTLVIQTIQSGEPVIGDTFSNDNSNAEGEVLTKYAYKDFDRGRTYLSDIGKFLFMF